MLSMIGITPHPPIIIPEIGRGELKKASRTVEGMKRLSALVAREEPERVIVITPHGQIHQGGPALPVAGRIAGDFGRFGFPGISMDLAVDRQLIDLIVEEASNSPLNPVLTGGGRKGLQHEEMLDHGALVPLYYLRQAGVTKPGILVTPGFNPLQEHYQFGAALRRAVEKRGLPTVVLASGDLSHRLQPGAPAGFNPRGKEFDHLLVELIGAGRVDDILNIDLELVADAGECGLRSFVIALGMLDKDNFIPEVISYEGPFGVGYLVAALYPDSKA